MKLSSSLIVKFLLGVSYLVDPTTATCAQDNCLRALFPTADPTRLSSAQSFCSTYLHATSTATTGFPPGFTTACGSSPSRYSSVCSCAPPKPTTTTTFKTTTKPTTTTTTTTPSPTCNPINDLIFKNGDFECSLFPWRALSATGTTAVLTSPGYNSNTAFTASQDTTPDGVGLGQATLSQLFQLTSGKQYTLQFATFWSAGNVGFIGLKINGIPKLTVDGFDHLGPGVWNLNTFVFVADGQCLLEFEFLFGEAGVFARIDRVTVTPGT